jgi:hypothetical protein
MGNDSLQLQLRLVVHGGVVVIRKDKLSRVEVVAR